MSNDGMIKPLCVFASAVALDRFAMGEEDLTRSAIFAGCTAVGVYASEIIAPHITPSIPQLNLNSSMYNEKTVGERVIELSFSASTVFGVNKYLLRNDIYKGEMLMRMGVIVASDVMGTYLAEYIDGAPMTYLE